MRRMLLLLAVAGMILALTAGPVFGAAREPTLDGPGAADQHLPDDTVADTKPAGKNCYGQAASNHVKGPGGDPGSYAVPTEFGGPNYTGHAVSTLDPVSQISGFQEQSREEFAAKSCDL